MFELDLDINHFLDHYWQKKPTVIKQGFIDFSDPILVDEIAGLAMEEEIWRYHHAPTPSPGRVLRLGAREVHLG